MLLNWPFAQPLVTVARYDKFYRCPLELNWRFVWMAQVLLKCVLKWVITVMGAEMKCDIFNVIVELYYLSNIILSVLLLSMWIFQNCAWLSTFKTDTLISLVRRWCCICLEPITLQVAVQVLKWAEFIGPLIPRVRNTGIIVLIASRTVESCIHISFLPCL